MHAVIMAGGKGTRLAALTNDEIPKPMLSIAGKPILEWQIIRLKENGILDIILVVGYLQDKIIQYFQDGRALGVRISYYSEEEPLGSAGGLYFVKDFLPDGPFLLVFGDVLFDIDIDRMLAFHMQKQAEATLFVHPNSHPFDSDLIASDADQRIIEFDSKHNDRSGCWYENSVNAGLYILERTLCMRIRQPQKTDLEKDVLSDLAHEGGAIYAYRSPEYIKDIGTPSRIYSAEQDLQNGIVTARNLRNRQRAIFLDRDGTINEYRGLVYREEDFSLYPFAAEAIKRINKLGFLAIVITNQPAAARGLCTIQDIDQIHRKMQTQLGEQGAYLDDIVYCPHHPDKGYPEEDPALKIECSCRKPNIGMLERCVENYNIDITLSWFIGDTTTDIKTGKNAGTHTILLLTGEAGRDGKYPEKADSVCANLLKAIKYIGGEKDGL